MNNFGISLYDPSGREFFSTKHTTWNYVGSFVAPANATAVRKFPAMKLLGEVIFQRAFVSNPPDNQEAIIHSVRKNADGITVEAFGGNVATLVTVLAR